MDGSTSEVMREAFGDAFAGGTLSAKQQWLNRNPDTARRLTRALLRAQQWIAAHTREEIRERLPEGFRSLDSTVDIEIISLGQRDVRDCLTEKCRPGAPEAVKHFLDVTIPKVRNSKIELSQPPGPTSTCPVLNAAGPLQTSLS